MPAPTPTVRQLPSGYKMPDGFRSLITFAKQPAVKFWEKAVKPPGIDGGNAIDTTTMHNNTWRTMHPRKLKSLQEVSTSVAYDPDVMPTIVGMINDMDVITVLFPDGSTAAFWGFLQKFEPGEFKEGEMPEATVAITPTNWCDTDNTEQGPVFTLAPGT